MAEKRELTTGVGIKSGGHSFDISSLHIESSSGEGQVIEAIIRRDHVSPEEAVLSALRESLMPEVVTVIHRESEAKRPGEALFGLFSDDPELMQNIAKDAREARDKEAVRDFGA